jgi:hypothetical protein
MTSLESLHQKLDELTTAVRFLRQDVEHLRKNGCTLRCPPPEDDPEEKTDPAVPSLRVVGSGGSP